MHNQTFFRKTIILYVSAISIYTSNTMAYVPTHDKLEAYKTDHFIKDVSKHDVENMQKKTIMAATDQTTNSNDNKVINNNKDKKIETNFKLTAITFVGNTIYSQKTLSNLFSSIIGTNIKLSGLQKIADKATKYYRKHGYILTQVIVPPQAIQNGVVKLKVIEGFINNVDTSKITNKSLARAVYRYSSRASLSGKPINSSHLEHYQLIANSLPGVSIQASLVPSPTVQGASDMIITGSQKRFDASLNFNNRGSVYMGPQRLTASANMNYVIFNNAASTSVFFVTTPKNTKQLQQSIVKQVLYLGNSGLNTTILYSHGKSQPSLILNDSKMNSITTAYSFGISYPYIRSKKHNLLFNLSLNHNGNDTNIFLDNLYNDITTNIQAGIYYDFFDKFKGYNSINTSVVKGIKANETDINSRDQLDAKFLKFAGNITRIQYFSKLPPQLSLIMTGKGQYSNDRVYPSDYFTYGGELFGGAYDQSELTGDSGLAGKIKLQYIKGMQSSTSLIYAFVDSGSAWTHKVGRPRVRTSATSSGVGLTLNFKHMNLSYEAAKPIKKPVASQVLLGKKGMKVRHFFKLVLSY